MINPFKYLRKQTVGLALGSGGAKGIAHIAVIECLRQMGIPIHYVAGSSIGAVIGALHCVGTLDRFKIDLLKAGVRDLLKLADLVFPRSGLIEGKDFMEFMTAYIPADARIEDLDTPLCIVATDYKDGTAVLFERGNILEALRASISIPGVFVPVKYRDTWLIDGGVSNPLPVNIVRRMGASMTIAVNLHPTLKQRFKTMAVESTRKHHVTGDPEHLAVVRRSRSLEKKGTAGSGTWLQFVQGLLSRDDPKKAAAAAKKECPSIFDVITQTIDIMEYVNTMLLLKYNAPTVLIEPLSPDVTTMDFMRAQEVLRHGEEACDRVRLQLKTKVKLWV